MIKTAELLSIILYKNIVIFTKTSKSFILYKNNEIYTKTSMSKTFLKYYSNYTRIISLTILFSQVKLMDGILNCNLQSVNRHNEFAKVINFKTF